MTFRPITRSEFPKVRHILKQIVETEEYIHLPHDSSEQSWEDYLFGDEAYDVWCLEEGGKILGAYHLRPNHGGLGNHIANGGYIVDPDARGQGIGKRLGKHSITRARELGYKAIQYNLVVSNNPPAVNCWKSLGFEIIGTIPKAYRRKNKELVDAYIMFMNLS